MLLHSVSKLLTDRTTPLPGSPPQSVLAFLYSLRIWTSISCIYELVAVTVAYILLLFTRLIYSKDRLGLSCIMVQSIGVIGSCLSSNRRFPEPKLKQALVSSGMASPEIFARNYHETLIFTYSTSIKPSAIDSSKNTPNMAASTSVDQ